MHTEYITFFDNEGFPNSGQLSRHCSRHNSISRKIGSSQLRKLGCHRFDLCRITFHESILINFSHVSLLSRVTICANICMHIIIATKKINGNRELKESFNLLVITKYYICINVHIQSQILLINLLKLVKYIKIR